MITKKLHSFIYSFTWGILVEAVPQRLWLGSPAEAVPWAFPEPGPVAVGRNREEEAGCSGCRIGIGRRKGRQGGRVLAAAAGSRHTPEVGAFVGDHSPDRSSGVSAVAGGHRHHRTYF
jgi:hypothetical protein